MEMGGRGGRLYTYRNTVITRMTYALRWAAMRAILMLIIIIIHKFSIALFPAERAQRACSHTCT